MTSHEARIEAIRKIIEDWPLGGGMATESAQGRKVVDVLFDAFDPGYPPSSARVSDLIGGLTFNQRAAVIQYLIERYSDKWE